MTAPTLQKVWGGVFAGASDARMDAFGGSLHIDARLALMDAAANHAHVQMLQHGGILSTAQAEPLLHALSAIKQELQDGSLVAQGDHEDVHTWLEAELSNRCGAAAENLRIARSRNDLVATDLKLWVRQASVHLGHAVLTLQHVLLAKAEAHAATAMPGYTHLQRAQPVTVGHHLLAYVAMLERDQARLGTVFSEVNASCPMGAGSLATSTWPVQPAETARLLGFAAPFSNSMDAVADRDFVLSLHYAITTCMTHLSRLAEDLILWTTAEFGFAQLPDAFSTGSSLMPQKKNPDVLELIRGRTAVTLGHFTGALALMKGLPLTYNRDMQEDKQPLFASFDILAAALGILAPFIEQLAINPHRCGIALHDDTILATDVADEFVRRGDSFAEAHHKTGAAVRVALQQGHSLGSTSGVNLDVATVLQTKPVSGGPGREPVASALAQAQGRWQANYADWQSREHKDRAPYEGA
jgi:argininosuccinate lyase